LDGVEDHRIVEGTGEASCPTPGRPVLVHYLVARRETKGIEVPHVLMGGGEEVLPVFSSAEAARRFLISQVRGEGWYVRQFSTGELVSLLFGLYGRFSLILPNPLPGTLSEDTSSPVSRDRFIESLIGS
jgi:hypothetical protein